MEELRNIEFQRTQDLSVIYQRGGSGFVRMTDGDHIVTELAEVIEREYPAAYTFLDAEYSKSKADARKHRFDIVRAFVSCNCGGVGDKMDIDDTGHFNFEFANCPSMFCKGRGIVCCAKHKTNMTKRQEETMRWLMFYMKRGHEPGEARLLVANKLGISPQTVDTNKRDAFEREGVSTMAEFALKFGGEL